MKIFLWIFIVIFSIPVFGQIDRDRNQTSDSSPYSIIQQDTVRRRRPLQGETTNDSITYVKRVITDYQYWRDDLKRIVVDTTLTIDSYYNQNFIGKDLFGKMVFPNVGRPLNSLEVDDKPFVVDLLPTGKRFNYIQAKDIRYFDVKTPITEFIYENGVRQGNYLSSLFSHNLNSQFNYAVQYRGLRSQGMFARELAANNAFIISSNYHTKDKRLNIWGHFSSQNIDNEENGGVTDILDFIEADERNLTNYRNIAVNLNNTSTRFDSRRYFLAASYGILPKYRADSTMYHAVNLTNKLTHETQIYKLFTNQTDANFYITDDNPLVSNNLFNIKKLKTFTNVTTAGFKWSDKLTIDAGVKFQNLNLDGQADYVYLSTFQNDNLRSWSESLFGIVGDINFDWNERLKLRGNLEFLQSSNHGSLYNIDAALDISPLKGYTLTAGVIAQSNIPSLNMMFNQSFLENQNYYNDAFENTNTQKLYGVLALDKINTKIEAAVYNIDNYVYLDSEFSPNQLTDNINYFKIKGINHLKFGQFNLVSTLQYQKVTKNEEFMPLPDFIARETFYWQGLAFDGKADVQIGVNGYYFSKFDSNGFFPLTNEFYLQDSADVQEIGGFPMLDLFINAKVKNMRFYIRGDHFNAIFGKREYFSAPGIPYRGFKFQIGIKWNIFT